MRFKSPLGLIAQVSVTSLLETNLLCRNLHLCIINWTSYWPLYLTLNLSLCYNNMYHSKYILVYLMVGLMQ